MTWRVNLRAQKGRAKTISATVVKGETHYATHRGDKSPRLHCCCDKAGCAYFVAAIPCTNSNQFEFVRQIAATKFCRSDNYFHVTRSDLLQQPAVTTCCSDLLHCVSRPLTYSPLGYFLSFKTGSPDISRIEHLSNSF